MTRHETLRRAVSDSLLAMGFTRSGYENRSHRIREAGEFQFCVDLGPLNKGDYAAPFVGLRHDQVELLSCQLLEIPGSENTATVGANVGFILAGEYRLWSFPDQCDEVIAAIVASRDALSIYATLDRLPEAWKLPATAVPGHWYNLAVVHHLLGDAEAVARWLDTGMRYDCDRDDAVCQQFLRFKANLERLPGSLAT